MHGDFNGGGLYCVNLARHLGKDQAFYAFHPYGLTEPVVPQTIEEMAADHLLTLFMVQPTGPYLLGGHCNGALIAFEMAHELIRRGQDVELVVLIAPSQVSVGQSPDSFPFIGPPRPGPDGGQPRRLNFSEVSRENRRAPLIQIYRRACGRYQLKRFPGRLFVAEAALKESKIDWRQLAERAEVVVVPGNHVTTVTKHVQELAAVLRGCLSAGPFANGPMQFAG